MKHISSASFTRNKAVFWGKSYHFAWFSGAFSVYTFRFLPGSANLGWVFGPLASLTVLPLISEVAQFLITNLSLVIWCYPAPLAPHHFHFCCANHKVMLRLYLVTGFSPSWFTNWPTLDSSSDFEQNYLILPQPSLCQQNMILRAAFHIGARGI